MSLGGLAGIREGNCMRKNPKYLTFIRSKCCVFCANPETEPHHIRTRIHTPQKWRGGIGLKPYDFLSVPVCRSCHRKLHDGSLSLYDPNFVVLVLLGEYIEKLQRT